MSTIAGSSSGKHADVDADGLRLIVKPMSNMETASRRTTKGAFVVPANPTNMADTSAHAQLYLLNTNNGKNIVIKSITMNSDLAGLFQLYTNVGYTSGGASVSPVNLYLGSSDVLGATCLKGEAGTELVLSGGDAGPSRYCPAGGQVSIEFENAMVIPYNKAIAIYFTGAAGSEVVSVDLLAYTEVTS